MKPSVISAFWLLIVHLSMMGHDLKKTDAEIDQFRRLYRRIRGALFLGELTFVTNLSAKMSVAGSRSVKLIGAWSLWSFTATASYKRAASSAFLKYFKWWLCALH